MEPPQSSKMLSPTPSFTSHSSSTLADIAARVIQEFRNQPHPDTTNLFDNWIEPQPEPEPEHHDSDDDAEFEFAFVGLEPNCSPISADELFLNGQIKPLHNLPKIDSPPKTTPCRRTSLRTLMVEDSSPSCSSSEADDLDAVPPGTYCAWSPHKNHINPDNNVGSSGRKCHKSSSTGSSNRWNLKNLVRRTNSDGDHKIISAVDHKTAAVDPKTTREGEKEKKKKSSYLPYKQDIMGILANVNGLSRNLHPF